MNRSGVAPRCKVWYHWLCQWLQVPAMALVLADHTITRVKRRRRNFAKKVTKSIIYLNGPASHRAVKLWYHWLCQWLQVPAMALVLADHTITRVKRRRRNFAKKVTKINNIFERSGVAPRCKVWYHWLCQWLQVPAMALVLADHTITRVKRRQSNFAKIVTKEIINSMHAIKSIMKGGQTKSWGGQSSSISRLTRSVVGQTIPSIN